MKRLLLVRHGETVWNSERRLQGQEDIPLSARGIEQARALAPVVRAFAPATVVASDLKRAHQTAEALGYGACKLDERLREAHLGAWVGLRAADLLREEPASYLAWREGTLTPPEGESFEQLQVRTLAVLQDVLREPGPVLVVTHGGVVRAALAQLLGLYPDRIVPVSPASLTIVDVEAGAPETGAKGGARLHSFNVTGYDALEPAPD